jgi:rhodanese-related sulfurtransferase
MPAVALTADDLQLLTTAEANALVKDGTALLYDTRSVEGYRILHAAGAISFPEADMAVRYGELPTDKALIFY